MRCRRPARDGLTLLELILALAIFVGSAAALSRLVILGLESAESAQFQAEATLVAENYLAEYSAGVLTTADSGTFPIDQHPGWEATTTVEPAGTAALYRVIVTITDPTGQPPGRFSVTMAGHFIDEVELAELLTPAETTDTSTTTGATTQ